MDEKNLSQLLEEVHNERAKTKAVDEKGRELLRDLKNDIQTLLQEQEREEPTADESMLERLEDSIEHFEESHPDLTSTLSKLINVLNNAGI